MQTRCPEASIAVGIDLVRVSQIADSVKRFGSRFLEKVYTTGELSYSLADVGSAAPRLAARFAAKEAVMKVLRVGDSAMSWEIDRGGSWPGGLVRARPARRSEEERRRQRTLRFFRLSLTKVTTPPRW